MPYDDVCGILCNYNTYDKLINFINNKKAKFKPDPDQLIQMLTGDFVSKVPLVISDEYLRQGLPNNDVPSPAYYQLQLIFDALDNGDANHKIVEYFLIAIRNFSRIKIPKVFELVNSIKAKNISLILQNKKYKESMKKSSDIVKEEECPLTNNRNCTKLIEYNNTEVATKEIEFKEYILSKLNEIKIEQVKFLYTNGIMHTDNLIESTSRWENIKSFLTFDLKIKRKLIPDFFKNAEITPSNRSSVYKLFVYDEISNEWKFDNNEFNFHGVDIIPLVSFIQSNTNQSFDILKNLCNNQLDNFELKSDEICVFAVFSKFVNDFRFEKNKFDKKKSDVKAIKPLFMLLYVPENKMHLPNISLVVFRIYLFLYVISNVNIIIIDENKCSDQVFILRQMEDIKNSLIDFDNTKIEKKKNENEGDYSDIDDDENQCNNNETKIIDFDSKLFDIQSKLLILFIISLSFLI